MDLHLGGVLGEARTHARLNFCGTCVATLACLAQEVVVGGGSDIWSLWRSMVVYPRVVYLVYTA